MTGIKYIYATSLLLLYIALQTSSTFAAEKTAGKTLLTRGNVVSHRSGKNITLKRRSAVFENDEIRVGESGRAQFRMVDQAVISLQENSVLQIKKYQYAQGSKNNSALLELLSGGLRTITGAIGKGNKKAYELRTPLATIGIRGTDYEVEIVSNGMFVAVWDGVIHLRARARNGCNMLLGRSQPFMFIFIDQLGKCHGLKQVPDVFAKGHSSNIAPPKVDSLFTDNFIVSDTLLARGSAVDPLLQLIQDGRPVEPPPVEPPPVEPPPVEPPPVEPPPVEPPPVEPPPVEPPPVEPPPVEPPPVEPPPVEPPPVEPPPVEPPPVEPPPVEPPPVEPPPVEPPPVEPPPVEPPPVEPPPVVTYDHNAFVVDQSRPSTELDAKASELASSLPIFKVGLDLLENANGSVVENFQQSVGGYSVSWGYWGDFTSTLDARSVSNNSDKGLIWATYEASSPDVVSARTGSFRYDTVIDSLISGSAGEASNLQVQMDANFESGAVTNGALSVNTPDETWVAVFDGKIESGDLDLQMNGASVINSDPNTPSPDRDASGFISGDFVGDNADAVLGSFGLSEDANNSNHVEGIFIVK